MPTLTQDQQNALLKFVRDLTNDIDDELEQVAEERPWELDGGNFDDALGTGQTLADSQTGNAAKALLARLGL